MTPQELAGVANHGPTASAAGRSSPTSPVAPPQRWQDQAACKDSSVDWFPHRDRRGGSPAYWSNLARARALCVSCLVSDECLSDALAHDAVGIWAGTTEPERRRLTAQTRQPEHRRRGQPIEHGTHPGYQTHRRRGEEPCLECRLANAVYHRDRRNGAA